MKRLLDHRPNGYELFELSAIDDLDLARLVPMLDRAWQADYRGQSRLVFDESVLRKLTPERWWVGVAACTATGEPVGFELALERSLHVRDRSLRAFYASVFSVAAEHRRRGLGRWVLEGINRLAFDERGADLMISTFHAGHAGSPTVQAAFDAIPGWGVVRFHETPIWSLRLDPAALPSFPSPGRYVRVERTAAGPEARLRAAGESAWRGDLPELVDIDRLLRTRFSASFGFDASLAGQYLDGRSEASGTLLFETGPEGFALACYNILPMARDERRLRPIGQLQLVLAPGCTAAEMRDLVVRTARFLAERGCFAMTLVDLGMVPREVLGDLGFAPSEDRIHFAVRGPESAIELFRDLEPPYFLDFT